jgi:Domain of unknown function (DUF397)
MEGNHAIIWRTASYSGNSGGQCIEVGNADRTVAVRDSKDPDGPRLAFAREAWQAFASKLKSNLSPGTEQQPPRLTSWDRGLFLYRA